jgi:hypothetical protein
MLPVENHNNKPKFRNVIKTSELKNRSTHRKQNNRRPTNSWKIGSIHLICIGTRIIRNTSAIIDIRS